MKFLTTNFLKCSVKTCDTSNDSFPLQYDGKTCQLQQNDDIEFNPEFLINILDRVDWDAIQAVAGDLGNTTLPHEKPVLGTTGDLSEDDLAVLKDLHTLLICTSIVEGQMQCKNCQHIYYIKNGIPNLLLPPHLA